MHNSWQASVFLTGALLAASLTLTACNNRQGEAAPSSVPSEDTPADAQSQMRVVSPTLQAIQRRGVLNCGVHQGLVGFAFTDNRGQWRGFDVSFCRALAAATLGSTDRTRFVPLSNRQRFAALRDRRVDVLWRTTSWTLSREADEGVRFAGVDYYDGQGFLVRRSLDLSSATELNGARICVQGASTSELNVRDYFGVRGLNYTPVVMANEDAARTAYASEDCDVLSADISTLAAVRTTLASPDQHAILPDVISKEPLGPAVRRGDESWTTIVRWTLNALILAEELGVTRENAAEMARNSRDPRVRRLLGVDGNTGAQLGLRRDWALKAIQASGNYGEIFAENLGPDTPLQLERGLNAQWNASVPGLIYALPLR